MDVEIRVVGVEAVVDLRWRVLRAGFRRETASFEEDGSAGSRHFAAVDLEGRVVGCLTLHESVWEGERAYQLRGMATDTAARGRGVGRLLMQAAEEFVREVRVRVMWCNARLPAVGFYERMRWVVVSEEFEVPTAGMHVRMVRHFSDVGR